MRTARDYEFRSYTPDFVRTPETNEDGWVVFATVMLGLAAVWSVVAGSLAVASSRVYSDNPQVVFGDLDTWGWILVILGIIQGFAVFMLVSESEYARSFGIGAAALSGIGQLMFVPAYPWWALATFSMDVLIIYALAVHAGAQRT
jgi:hypothetical protein